MVVKEISERAQRVHREAIVIDMLETVFPAMEIGYFKSLVDAGVTAIHVTVPYVTDDLPVAIENIAKFYEAMESAKNAKVAYSAADIESAKKEGKVAIIAGMQDSIPFERNLDLIRTFDKLGIRVVQIAYSQQNYLGAGCGERIDHGLTDQGREAIKELNRLGILIDVSHCGDKTAMDAAEASEAPIAITHTTPAALVDLLRARTDETMKAVAERGGVIGQVIVNNFCTKKGKEGVRATLSDFADLIDHMVSVVGIDHVGFGTDFSPFWKKEGYDAWHKKFDPILFPGKTFVFETRLIEGFTGVSDTIKITEELLSRGYSETETSKILGGNWLRLVKEVWGG